MLMQEVNMSTLLKIDKTAEVEDDISSSAQACDNPNYDGDVKCQTMRTRTTKKLRGNPSQLLENKLLRKVSKAINSYFSVTGKNIVTIVQTSSKPQLKIFGTKPLVEIVRKLRKNIENDLKNQDTHKIPFSTLENEGQFELPPLVIDGVPKSLHQMTQGQLRSFIPLMIKYSTCRGKPGWGKVERRPPWWPDDTPWENIRTDTRPQEVKELASWTTVLRQIILSCYTYHDRLDLLESSDEFFKRVNTKIDFLTYDDCLKRCNNPRNNVKEIIVREKPLDDQVSDNKQVDCAGKSPVIIIQSNQPCYIYKIPKIVNPNYSLPADLDEIFSPANQTHDFPNITQDTSHVVIQEIESDPLIWENEKRCDQILPITQESRQITGNRTILPNANVQNSSAESILNTTSSLQEISGHTNTADIKNAEFIILDEKCRCKVDDMVGQRVFLLDGGSRNMNQMETILNDGIIQNAFTCAADECIMID